MCVWWRLRGSIWDAPCGQSDRPRERGRRWRRRAVAPRLRGWGAGRTRRVPAGRDGRRGSGTRCRRTSYGTPRRCETDRRHRRRGPRPRCACPDGGVSRRQLHCPSLRRGGGPADGGAPAFSPTSTEPTPDGSGVRQASSLIRLGRLDRPAPRWFSTRNASNPPITRAMPTACRGVDSLAQEQERPDDGERRLDDLGDPDRADLDRSLCEHHETVGSHSDQERQDQHVDPSRGSGRTRPRGRWPGEARRAWQSG